MLDDGESNANVNRCWFPNFSFAFFFCCCANENLSDSTDMHYSVEHVEERRLCQDTGTLQYLLNWENHSEADNSWEPRRNLVCCSDAMAACDATASRQADALIAYFVQQHTNTAAEEPSSPTQAHLLHEDDYAPLTTNARPDEVDQPYDDDCCSNVDDDGHGESLHLVVHDQVEIDTVGDDDRACSSSPPLQTLEVLDLTCGEKICRLTEAAIHTTVQLSSRNGGDTLSHKGQQKCRRPVRSVVGQSVGNVDEHDGVSRVVADHEASWSATHTEGLYRLSCVARRAAWWRQEERRSLHATDGMSTLLMQESLNEKETHHYRDELEVLALVPAWACRPLDFKIESPRVEEDDTTDDSLLISSDDRPPKRPRSEEGLDPSDDSSREVAGASDVHVGEDVADGEELMGYRRIQLCDPHRSLHDLDQDELVVEYRCHPTNIREECAPSATDCAASDDDSPRPSLPLPPPSLFMSLSSFREEHPQTLLDFLLERSLILTATSHTVCSHEAGLETASGSDNDECAHIIRVPPIDGRQRCTAQNSSGAPCREMAVSQFDYCPAHLFCRLGVGVCSALVRRRERNCCKRVALGLTVCPMHYLQAAVDAEKLCAAVVGGQTGTPVVADAGDNTTTLAALCGAPVAIGSSLCPCHLAKRYAA
jgi:hypothetical protein